MVENYLPKFFCQAHFLSLKHCAELIAQAKYASTHSTSVSAQGISKVKENI
jgi:hypothetical protein